MEREDFQEVETQVEALRKNIIDWKQIAKLTKKIIEQLAKQKKVELVYIKNSLIRLERIKGLLQKYIA